jgi:hypothetical protein
MLLPHQAGILGTIGGLDRLRRSVSAQIPPKVMPVYQSSRANPPRLSHVCELISRLDRSCQAWNFGGSSETTPASRMTQCLTRSGVTRYHTPECTASHFVPISTRVIHHFHMPLKYNPVPCPPVGHRHRGVSAARLVTIVCLPCGILPQSSDVSRGTLDGPW